jgi:hypothetical protein
MSGSQTLPTPTGFGPRSLGRRRCPTLAPVLAISWQRASRAWGLLQVTPPGRVVRTRHGDPMLLSEFLRTRVFELAVHGLDLAAALEREPWMTAPAAESPKSSCIPAPAGARLRAETGWDWVTLIAKLTGRSPLTSVERRLIEPLGSTRLALG